MIISFGWTTPALLAGAKTCTRRDWQPRTAAAAWKAKTLDVWNANPRNPTKDPHKIARIHLSREPEQTAALPEEDYEREGFAWLEARGQRISIPGHAPLTPAALWRLWRQQRPVFTVVRFELVEIFDLPLAAASRALPYDPASIVPFPARRG